MLCFGYNPRMTVESKNPTTPADAAFKFGAEVARAALAGKITEQDAKLIAYAVAAIDGGDGTVLASARAGAILALAKSKLGQ